MSGLYPPRASLERAEQERLAKLREDVESLFNLTDEELRRDEEILKELIKIRNLLQLKEARIQTKKTNKRLKKEAKNREQLERIAHIFEEEK